MAPAAGHHLAALVLRVAQQFFHFFDGRFGDHRTDVHTALIATPHFQRPHGNDELLHELVVHRVLHVYAVGAYAGLAGIAVLADDGALHGGLDVGVVKHDERCVAAQFHGYFFHRGGALADQLFAHAG